ncbi:MAG TPA: DNA methyltransferase [Gemmatimonadaceae bacterium]|jgi:hypothetical protein|nr:DNA methyltransferase [Gemmatimonadaceae bacterium]
MATPAEIRAHQEWLGFVQPVGLVVSPAALVNTQAQVDRNIAAEQETLKALTREEESDEGPAPIVWLPDLPAFFTQFLGWEASDLVGGPGAPELAATLDVAVPDYDHDLLSPTYAVPQPDATGAWVLLIRAEAQGTDLDKPSKDEDDRRWNASPQARFERLLRANDVPIGVLTNRTHVRLVYAPHLESTGHLTFKIADLCTVAGRPLVSALLMLLGARRLFSGPTEHRLPAILRQSRRYQNEVSTELAEQVLAALNALLRGFRAANDVTGGALLADVLREKPDDVYGGLLATLMRLVFVLYAEDRDLLPADDVYQKHYSVTTLFEQLRDDVARYPDTMDQRFGAWSRLLTLFRLIHDGGGHGGLRLPARHGRLFDPDAYPFLEGRPFGTRRVLGDRLPAAPRVSDGVIYHVLRNLLLLQGERLSYRTLDVEQIGSVYEAMMGFSLRQAEGPSISLRPTHIVVNLQDLLEVPAAKRAAWLKEQADCEVKAPPLAAADSIDALVAALEKRISPTTPAPLRAGDLYLQPTDERRRSGSHYTPRTLTEPIVKTTLKPVLEALGENPTPDQILEQKVCDPAMGSGAFLVEACRHLAERLASSWRRHNATPSIPPDEDVLRHAQRIVAQRCLYGVDKNPFAVDLAKLSLWLATFAKDHPFTFLDHALKAGDSLVGLSREQIAWLHWSPSKQLPLVRELVEARVEQARELRTRIEAMADSDDTKEKQRLLGAADQALADIRLIGDAVIAAFFMREKPKDRANLRVANAGVIELWLNGQSPKEQLEEATESLSEGEHPVEPFHWAVEFPEVFMRAKGGFDAFVGNPPFAGKNTIAAGHRQAYLPWLLTIHEESHGNADLVAHFFRRTFNLLRPGGALGLIATNTIAQGDTRSTGLRWVCTHGGTIFSARKRYRWPGRAAVVVSVVHVRRGQMAGPFELDGRMVDMITAFLFHRGGHENPAALKANEGKSFQGSIVLGMGFTFDDTDKKGVANPISLMHELIAKDARNAERIFPYIGGEEVNNSPTHAHHRYVINFDQMSEEEARRWPDLIRIVEEKVRPDRLTNSDRGARKQWWQFLRPRPELQSAIRGFGRVLVIPRVSETAAFSFLPDRIVYSDQLVVFTYSSFSAFGVLQSRPHESWARLLSSSMKDDLRYTPSDCFETFPFPANWEHRDQIRESAKNLYEFRAALMIGRNQGLTSLYNDFNNRDERDPEIIRLRALHEKIDRAVMDAYDWSDIPIRYDFFVDQVDEDEIGNGSAGGRRERHHYRWPDDVREEVLARLLDLNRQRAEEERLTGALNDASKPKAKRRKASPSADGRSVLF